MAEGQFTHATDGSPRDQKELPVTVPKYSIVRRSALAAGATAALLLLGAAGASADQSAPSPDSVVAALVAGGADADRLTDELTARVNERIDRAIEAGVLTEEEVARVEELRDSGELADRVADRVAAKKKTRAEHRRAVVERLAEAGIEIAEGQSVREALDEAGFDRDEISELMKRIRPHLDGDEREVDEAGRSIDDLIDRVVRDNGSDRAGDDGLRDLDGDGDIDEDDRAIAKRQSDERKDEREKDGDERKEEREKGRDEPKAEHKEHKDEPKSERKAEHKDEPKDEGHIDKPDSENKSDGKKESDGEKSEQDGGAKDDKYDKDDGAEEG